MKTKGGNKRRLSKEARKAIGDAQRKRWAKQKTAVQNTPRAVVPEQLPQPTLQTVIRGMHDVYGLLGLLIGQLVDLRGDE